jgi:hypothetical protein
LGVKAVFVVVYGFLGGGDLASDQVGLALHIDVETAIACSDSTLLAYALEVAVDLGAAAGVLQGLYPEVAFDYYIFNSELSNIHVGKLLFFLPKTMT